MWKYNPSNSDTLFHYGKGHLDGGHSGRYPWGSGDKNNKKNVASTKASSSDSNNQKAMSKKIAMAIVAAAATATVAAAAVYVSLHPVAKNVVKDVIESIGDRTINSDKVVSLISKGKDCARKTSKMALEGLKEGLKEGIKNGPKKFAAAATTGAAMYGGKKLLDALIGKDDAGRIMKANDKKKIGSFWAYIDPDEKETSQDDRNDE